MRALFLLISGLPALASADPLRVVTDIPPVHSLVSQVMGDRGEVSVLLGQNADPHHFQLRPSQSREIARADLLVWVGEELTPWLARAHEGIASDVQSLTFLESDEDHDDGGHHGEDPHIWLETHEAEEMLQAIVTQLSVLDPDGAETYQANGVAAIDRLDELEAEIAEKLAPVSEVPFVVGHAGYGYFVEQFGLTMIDSLTDVHDSPASAKHVSKLARLARDGGIACVFPEVGESDKLASVLVGNGAKMGAALDPAGVGFKLGPDLHRELLMKLADDIQACLAS